MKALGVTADQYSNTLLSNDTPLDLLGVFIVARLYWIHVAVIMSGGVWSTSRTNDIWLAKFTFIYRNVTEFVETCYLDGAALYIDSLILNMQHGRMPCHRDIAKLEGAETTADEPVDLTVSDDTAKDQPVVPIDMKPVVKLERLDNKKALKFNVILQKPTNRKKASTYAKALQILLKAKTELATKSECKDITDKIKQHIQSGIIDPALVTKHACANRMISCNCEFCGELCQSRRAYVRHRMEFHPEQLYVCRYCCREYQSATGCFKHERTHVSPGCACAVCGRLFKTSTELKDHMLVHNDANKLSCETCGKLFSTKRTLKRHSEVHMNLQYPCPECGCIYNTKERLRVHRCGYHGNGYTALCGKYTFQWPGKRQRHQKKCEECKAIAAAKKAEKYI